MAKYKLEPDGRKWREFYSADIFNKKEKMGDNLILNDEFLNETLVDALTAFARTATAENLIEIRNLEMNIEYSPPFSNSRVKQGQAFIIWKAEMR